jgi:hypothetical protein
MSPLAAAAYEILRGRTALPEPRITYAELARELRDLAEEFAHIGHRSRELYAALGEVGRECRRRWLPPLPALVVRADTRRPGAAYFTGKRTAALSPGGRVAAWWSDLQRVRQCTYPPP